jgi:ELWxxDGT repeat protein
MVPNAPFVGADVRVIGRTGESVFLGTFSGGSTALHVTDGTATGTRTLATIPSGSETLFPEGVTIGRRLVFPVGHSELWVTEGTDTSTKRIAQGNSSSYFGRPTPLTGAVAFMGASEVVITDGTPQGTRVTMVSKPSYIVPLSGQAVLLTSWEAQKLWRIDGAGAIELEHDRRFAVNTPPAAAASGAVFGAALPGKGTELLFKDGTPGGARLVSDVLPGAGSSTPENLKVGIGRVFFSAEDAEGDRELYAIPVTALP